MKSQNSSIHGFKVMLCIKKRDERTDGRKDRRTEGRTDGRTNNPEAICPSNFFEVGGIKKLGDDESAHLCSDQSSLFVRRNFASLAVQNAPNEVSELTAQMHKFQVTSECI